MLSMSHRKLTLIVVLLVGSVATLGIQAQSGISMTVYPALAPNAFGSPSFAPWDANAINALINNQSTAGNPTLPSYYQQIPNGSLINKWMVSEFPSWLNQANPGTVFGPAFANEFGNRLYFNLHVNGNGQVFRIADLSLQTTSTDPANFLGFDVPAGTYTYTNSFVGLQYGPNGVLGGGDDVFITSGPNTQFVNELFARGSGNAAVVQNSDPGATDQDKINGVYSDLPTSFIFSGTYTLNNDGLLTTGNAFVVVSVPEPSTIMMAGLAGTALVTVCVRTRRRRKMRRSRTATPAPAQ